VLFPPGISNAPIEQLQQFYGAAFANRMVSANDIEKRNLVSPAPPPANDGQFDAVLSGIDVITRTHARTPGRNGTGFLSHS